MARATATTTGAVPLEASESRRRFRRGFVSGVVCGLLALYLGGQFINYTKVADLLVAPLLATPSGGPADAIVVAGAGVTGPCVPNNYAMRRALLAARLWRQSRAPRILFTGGHEASLPCPVSEVMAGLARELGVPADRIVLERASRNTHENGELAAPILRSMGAQRILLVTDRLHMRRASAVFARHGFTVDRAPVPVYESHPDNISMLRAGLREYAALAYYQARGWLSPPAGAARAAGDGPESVRARLITYTGQARSAPPASAAAMTTPPQTPRTTVVILGASYAEGWHPAIPGFQVVNAGITGQQSFELRERFDRDVVAHAPRAVIVWGFINDVFRAPRPKIDDTLRKTRENFVQMVAQARAHGIEPILATEVTIRPQLTFSETIMSWVGWALGKESYQDYVNGHVLAVNAWLRELARKEGVLLLDLQPVVSDASNVRRREYSKDDGSHITPAGYAALSTYAQPLLAARLGASR